MKVVERGKLSLRAGAVMKRNGWLFLVLTVVVYFGGIVVVFQLSSDWLARQTWAMILTGVVVLWYTWETAQLRLAASAQRELQIRPFVVVERESGHFRVRNLGHAPALNVKVGDVVINRDERILVSFPDLIPTLAPGEVRAISVESSHAGVPAKDFFVAHLNPDYANRDLEIRVDYQNIEMKDLFVLEVVGPGKLEILRVSED